MENIQNTAEALYISALTIYNLSREGLIVDKIATEKIQEAENFCIEEIERIKKLHEKMQETWKAIQKMK